MNTNNLESLHFKITDIGYEYTLVKLSSSKRDADQNSELDRYEARLNKVDAALLLQNKVSAAKAVEYIDAVYGPFYEDEIEHYKSMLSKNGTGLINPLQYELLGYVYYKELGDPITWKSIPNGTAYVKLMIAAKRMYLNAGLVILPYIFSSRVLRVSTRKVMGKKEITELQNSQLYMTFKNKYNNPKIEQHFNELVGRVESSSFEIIDWDNKNHCPGEFDGKMLPMISDIINEELLYYAVMA